VAQVKRIRRNVSGIILLDKPLGFTSNAALQKVRWLLNAEKAGHTGSLDPLATGVLPLCFGEATKFSQYLLDSDKGYETVMQWGRPPPPAMPRARFCRPVSDRWSRRYRGGAAAFSRPNQSDTADVLGAQA
jgi:hypothetical protein